MTGRTKRQIPLGIFHLSLWCVLLVILNVWNVGAQEAFQISPRDRRGDKPTLPDELKPLESRPVFTLPPPPPVKEKEASTMPLKKVFIKKIIISGSTVFTPEELEKITAPYQNQWVTSEDLEKLRQDLTLYYINNGYVTSGAVLPDQNVSDGTINYKVIEGEIVSINIENNKWLWDSYIEKRVALGAGTPVNMNALQKQLQLLQKNPRIDTLNAELKPGLNLGESDLDIDVKESFPIKLWVAYDNYLSQNSGPEEIRANATHMSLTGNGDILSFTYGRSDGSDGLNPLIDAAYSFPITKFDTLLSFRYQKNNYDLLSEFFQDLDIETETDIYTIRLDQPIFRDLNHDFTLALIGEKERSQTKLLGEYFSLEPGAIDGEIKISALRFEQNYTYRTQSQVIAARSRFSFGIDACGATMNDYSDLPDGEFFVWLGQFQWLQRYNPWDIQLLFRGDVQLTDDPLFSLEKMAVGGRYTVRGYNENQLVRDRAAVFSLESRIPLIQDKSWADYLQIVPFFDFGWADNVKQPNFGPNQIYSVGVGLRWALTLPTATRIQPIFEIYYGRKLKDVDSEDSGNLQDHGIHFQFAIAAF